MNELKTLKDIERELFSQDISGKNALWELKQEAIKWIKAFKEAWASDNPIPEEFEDYMNESTTFCETISWIKHFFNISDEELK